MQGKIESPSDYSLLDILFWLFKPQIMAKIVDNDHTSNLVVKFKKSTIPFAIYIYICIWPSGSNCSFKLMVIFILHNPGKMTFIKTFTHDLNYYEANFR